MAIKILKNLHATSLRHLREAGEGYGKHFLFTLNMAWEIGMTAIYLMLHGLIPGCHTRTASRRIEAIHRVLQQRVIRCVRNNGVHG
ncbi:MAG: hypothetical protein J0L97_01705 [Alphaproteobacteria bacterium]|nr:hypothetical protein [Alphaproteobacteria bacterium]